MTTSTYLRIVSLAHRHDRRSECINELRSIGIEKCDGAFFDAKHTGNLGALGCAMSHAMVLSEFLFTRDEPFVLVLEDDFEIKDPHRFCQTIDEALLHASHWDVFLLGHNTALPIESTHMEGTVRVVNAQTMSGYLTNRIYATKLIQTFFESAELLRKYSDLPGELRELTRPLFCCDMLWKKRQIEDRYWTTFPGVIKQRKSYSDIEKTIVDYGV